MVRTQGLIRLLGAVAGAALLTACGSSGCGSGAGSATEAVTGMLRAAETGSREEVCRFVPDVAGQTDHALTRHTTLRPAITKAGGIDRLSLRVDPTRQMGSEHVVAASVAGAPVAEFVVMEQSGRFLVFPEAEPSSR